jgi:RNA polymerase sigma factor (sigma-70 family)
MTASLYSYLLSSDAGDNGGDFPQQRGRAASGTASAIVSTAASGDPVLHRLRSPRETEAQQAFDDLFRETYAKLVRFAVQYVGTTVAAEDVVGDVFSSVWANRPTIETRGSLEGYLFGAVRHQAVSAYRRSMRHTAGRAPVLADGEHWGMGVPAEAPDAGVTESGIRAVVWNAIAELPIRQREILTLRWQAELGWDDIARALESTGAAVQMQHSRAIKTLRIRLAGDLG